MKCPEDKTELTLYLYGDNIWSGKCTECGREYDLIEMDEKLYLRREVEIGEGV